MVADNYNYTPLSHHFPPSTAHVAEVVVPLLPEDGRSAHERHGLLVFRTPGVLEVPELDMSETSSIVFAILDTTTSPYLLPAVTK